EQVGVARDGEGEALPGKAAPAPVPEILDDGGERRGHPCGAREPRADRVAVEARERDAGGVDEAEGAVNLLDRAEHLVLAGRGEGRVPELAEVGGRARLGAVRAQLVEGEVEQGHRDPQEPAGGGAVDCRMTSSVARSMRELRTFSPRARRKRI